MIGSKLGNYEILARIGTGGTAEVYRPRDLNLYREVALKILPREMADPELKERLQREARTLATLNHPNIVTVYSVEESLGVHFTLAATHVGRERSLLVSIRCDQC